MGGIAIFFILAGGKASHGNRSGLMVDGKGWH